MVALSRPQIISTVILIAIGITVEQVSCVLPTSFRTKIRSIDDNGQIVRSISSLEKYSKQGADGHIEIGSNEDDWDSNASFYYRTTPSTKKPEVAWVKVAQQKCYSSSQEDLDQKLYGERLPAIEGLSTGLGGAANLLMLLKQPQSSVNKSRQKSIGPSREPTTRVNATRSIQSEMTLEGDGQVRMMATYIDKEDALPIRLELTYMLQSPGRQFTIVIDFYDLEKTPALGAANLQDSIAFPTAIGCPRVLMTTNSSTTRLTEFSDYVYYVSFGARVSDYSQTIGDTTTMQFVFSFAHQLLSRTVFLKSSDIPGLAESTTIYDFNRCKKYHFSTSLADNSRDDALQCVNGEWEFTEEFGQLKFIQFNKLQFMGKGIYRDMLVDIYEDDHLERLPFWLAPPQNGKQQPLELLGQVSLVYYFSSQGDGELYKKLGNLVYIEVQMLSPPGNAVLLRKRLEIFDFAWNQPQLTPVDPLSLVSAGCTTGSSLKRYSTHISMVLEPLEGKNDTPFEDHAEVWSNQATVDDALIKALVVKYSFRRTHIDFFRSHQFGQSSPPLLEVDFGASLLSLPHVECVSLGRGNFMNGDTVARFESFSFEDCAWIAHHFGQSQEIDVIFTLDLKNLQCLIDSRLKWRQLQEHEAALAGTYSREVSSLNYLPFDFGIHRLFTLNYTAASGVDHLQISSLRPTKSMQHVGADLSVRFPLAPEQSRSVQVQYLLTHMRVDDHLINTEDPLSTAEKLQAISGLSFVETSANDSLVRRQKQLVTRSLCRSLCMMDEWCHSYSFCDSRSRPECSLSALDIDQPELQRQLSTMASINAKLSTVQQIQTSRKDLSPATETVSIRLDRKCIIAAKPYVQLFVKLFQMDIYVDGDAKGVEMVSSENECAKLCFNQNLRYLSSLVGLKQDLEEVRDELRSILASSEQSTDNDIEYVSKLEAKLSWHNDFAKQMCTHFYYGPKSGAEVGTPNYCLLSDPSKPFGTQTKTGREEKLDYYKMQYIHLYEKQTGFKLASATGPDGPGVNSNENMTDILVSYLSGRNIQVQIVMDNPEDCARACTLQTHGPRPSCASFDFVHERTSSQSPGWKYCLLNTQSIHDLNRRRQDGRETGELIDNKPIKTTSYYTQYWHYEPREKLLMTPNSTRQDANLLALLSTGSSISEFIGRKETGHSFHLQRNICLVLIVLSALLCGLFMGVKLGKFWLAHRDPDEINLKNRMIRIVHRLSGASLSPLPEREVRLS